MERMKRPDVIRWYIRWKNWHYNNWTNGNNGNRNRSNYTHRESERERVISTAKPILYIKSSNRKSQMESDFHVSLTF